MPPLEPWKKIGAVVLAAALAGLASYAVYSLVAAAPEAGEEDEDEDDEQAGAAAPAAQPKGAAASSSASGSASPRGAASSSEGARAASGSGGGSGGSSGGGGGGSGGRGLSKATLLLILKDMLKAYQKADEERERSLEELQRTMSSEQADQIVGSRMAKQMETINNSLEAKYQAGQMDIMGAMQEYKEDAEVQALVREVQRLLLGEDHVKEVERQLDLVPKDLTVEAFLVKFSKYQEVLARRIRAVMERARKDMGPGKTPEEKMYYLQLLMQRDQPDAIRETEASTGMSEEVFKGCIQKFSSDERVSDLMGELQRELQPYQTAFFES